MKRYGILLAVFMAFVLAITLTSGCSTPKKATKEDVTKSGTKPGLSDEELARQRAEQEARERALREQAIRDQEARDRAAAAEAARNLGEAYLAGDGGHLLDAIHSAQDLAFPRGERQAVQAIGIPPRLKDGVGRRDQSLDDSPIVHPSAAAQDQVFGAELEGQAPLLAAHLLVEGKLPLLPAE